MTETTTSTKVKANGSSVADVSAALREDIIASVKQAQQFTLDAVTTWMDAINKVVPSGAATPFLPNRSEVVEGLGTMFEVAEELLALQRKFASDVINVVVPA